MTIKNTHGGKRKGAGRPPADRTVASISVSVPISIKAKLKDMPRGQRSKLIVQLLKHYYETKEAEQ